MLRRTILTLLATLPLATAQSGATADEVKKAEMNWAAAVKKMDLKALDQILADDLVYTHSSGVIETKQEYLEKLKLGAQKYTAIDYTNPRVQAYGGDTGIVTTRARMAGATKGVPFDNQLLMIHVWVKQGGKWQLAAHQTTRLQ